jgi:hypothetical protein
MPLAEPIGREATCGKCGNDLHSCRNCRHFDVRYARSCREPMADPVEDVSRRNFCDYYSFSREPFAGTSASSDSKRQADARARLEALFKKPKPAD